MLMMVGIGERIRRRREELGIKQEKLAELVGTNQQTISRIESGETTHSRYMPAILRALDMHEDPPSRPTIAIPRFGGRDLPVYASARGGEGETIMDFNPIDFTARPEQLANVKKSFAMYIVGDSMAPEFEQGDLAYVNPNLPYTIGKTVLIFKEQHGETTAIVKRLVRATSEAWMLEQWNPAKKFSVSRREWPFCHRIVGKWGG